MREAGYITKGGAVICKVPATDTEALNSDLMGMLEKRRCKNFFVFVQTYDVNEKKTHQGFTEFNCRMDWRS
jgi:Rab GDP dissociation inhibitor